MVSQETHSPLQEIETLAQQLTNDPRNPQHTTFAAAGPESLCKNLLIKCTSYLNTHSFSQNVYNFGLEVIGKVGTSSTSPSHALANLLHLQAALLRHSPDGHTASISKMEEAVKVGINANPNATTKKKAQLKREAQLRKWKVSFDEEKEGRPFFAANILASLLSFAT